ncbi:MAG: hypothetical protein WC074_05770, partial [bacterium]
SPRAYEHFHYLIWLLSNDSRWLPEPHRDFLLRGMRDWAAWSSSPFLWKDKGEDFSHWLCETPPTECHLNPASAAFRSLQEVIATSAAVLELSDHLEELISAFLDGGFIYAHITKKQRHSKNVV